MKKQFLTLILFAIIGLSNLVTAQTPNWSWAKSIGGTSDDQGTSIAMDATGNVYTTGTFTDTVDFDPGPGVFNLTSLNRIMFISKLDAAGNFAWAKQIEAGFGQLSQFAITVDILGNVYTTGSFGGTVDFDPGAGIFNLTATGQSDIFILKMDGSGNFLMAFATSGTGSSKTQNSYLTVDPNGNIFTSCSFYGTVDFNPGAGTLNYTATGQNDLCILKLDSSGNFVWAKQIGGAGTDLVSGKLSVDVSGNVYTAGTFMSIAGVDFDPGAGSVILSSASGAEDMFISKLDVSGNFVWVKQIGGAGIQVGTAISLDLSSNLYTTGFFNSTTDFDPDAGIYNLSNAGNFDIFISKIDSSGNFIWARAMGGYENDFGYSLATDAGCNVYSTGVFSDTADFDPGADTINFISAGYDDIFISKLDSSGNFQYAKSFGGSNEDHGNSIALDASGHAVITGYYKSNAFTCGITTLTNADNTGNTSDIFIAKLDSSITSGIANVTKNNAVSIYPNPAADYFTINLTGNQHDFKVTIYDRSGKIIPIANVITSSGNKQKIEVETKNFAVGVYLVRIQTKDFIETKKLIVSR